MFALADCNNFYASCERAFNPKLANKPIVVLSNNDGCIIARSSEAKQLGIPMGGPAFKCENLFRKYDVKVFSANFTLYGNISNRVMSILSEYTSDLEIYSIDEAFFSLKFASKDLTKYCAEIRYRILKGTGIPVSIGIAPTKTLAKICNHIAKKTSIISNEFSGVFNWNEVADKDTLLKSIPVGDIWGIGFRTTEKYNANGIYNALQLKNSNDAWLKKNFTIAGSRIALELQGTPCLELENVHEPRKGIMSSRSFGKPVESMNELEEAVATYISRAAEKLREQRSACSYVYVSIKTNKHRKDQPQYFDYRILPLPYPTWYLPTLISTGLKALKEIYRKGYRYKKATVMLLGIVPQNQMQLNIFSTEEQFNRTKSIMKAFDQINHSFGSEFIKYAATGIRQRWRMKQEKISNRYTTSWDELLTVKI